MARLIAYVNCLDPSLGTGDEVYEHGAVHPDLWQYGWQHFYEQTIDVEGLLDAGVRRFMLAFPFGYMRSADAVTIGYSPAQAAVTTRGMGPRQSETDLQDDRLVNGVASKGLPSFAEFWIAKVATIVGRGGHVICLMGPPPFDTSSDPYTLDNWVREPESCNMALAMDGSAGCDRLSYLPPVAALDVRLAGRNRSRYCTQHEAGSVRLAPWYETAGAISGRTRADLVVATPTSYLSPAGGIESVVILDASISVANRLLYGLTYMTQSSNQSPWSAAVDLTDLTTEQITVLVEAGG